MKTVLILCLYVLTACTASKEGTTSQQLCTMNSTDPCCPGSPILIDLAGDGIHLTSAKDGVIFHLRPEHVGQWAWTQQGSDDAFLTLDRNANDIIDDGSELFGDGSPQALSAFPNGFMALAVFDWSANGGNGDGVIDAQDSVWPRLRLWRDANHDGLSTPDELLGLDASGVHGFSLAITPSDARDEHGNEFRFTAPVIADPPVAPVASDVWLRQVLPTTRDYTEWTCEAWGYAWTSAPPKTACTNANIYALPIVNVLVPGWGNMGLRQVVKFSTSTTSRTTAAFDAAAQVQSADNPWCELAPFPIDDPLEPGPYYIYGASPSTPRVKCWSHVVRNGTGC